MSLGIVIIDKIGELKTLNVKNYCEEELYKKCGFKKDTNFVLQTTWNVSLNDINYSISMYGKTDGKKNFENICNFPYPINDKKFFGSCALVASSEGNKINLNVELWKQLYQKISENTDQTSFSFINQSEINIKSNKREKQRKKEQDKEKDKERENENDENNENELNTDLFQELEEEDYCYSSDEENVKIKNKIKIIIK
jgi:hypothetical protein